MSSEGQTAAVAAASQDGSQGPPEGLAEKAAPAQEPQAEGGAEGGAGEEGEEDPTGPCGPLGPLALVIPPGIWAPLERVQCSECGSEEELDRLEQHINAEHLDYYPFSCGHCQVSMPTEAAALRHSQRKNHLPPRIRENTDARLDAKLHQLLTDSYNATPRLPPAYLFMPQKLSRTSPGRPLEPDSPAPSASSASRPHADDGLDLADVPGPSNAPTISLEDVPSSSKTRTDFAPSSGIGEGVQEELAASAPVKRGRGRPRKRPLPAAEESQRQTRRSENLSSTSSKDLEPPGRPLEWRPKAKARASRQSSAEAASGLPEQPVDGETSEDFDPKRTKAAAEASESGAMVGEPVAGLEAEASEGGAAKRSPFLKLSVEEKRARAVERTRQWRLANRGRPPAPKGVGRGGNRKSRSSSANADDPAPEESDAPPTAPSLAMAHKTIPSPPAQTVEESESRSVLPASIPPLPPPVSLHPTAPPPPLRATANDNGSEAQATGGDSQPAEAAETGGDEEEVVEGEREGEEEAEEEGVRRSGRKTRRVVPLEVGLDEERPVAEAMQSEETMPADVEAELRQAVLPRAKVVCGLCGETGTGETLAAHFRQHYVEQPRASCVFCGWASRSAASVRGHISWHHPDKAVAGAVDDRLPLKTWQELYALVFDPAAPDPQQQLLAKSLALSRPFACRAKKTLAAPPPAAPAVATVKPQPPTQAPAKTSASDSVPLVASKSARTPAAETEPAGTARPLLDVPMETGRTSEKTPPPKGAAKTPSPQALPVESSGGKNAHHSAMSPQPSFPGPFGGADWETVAGLLAASRFLPPGATSAVTRLSVNQSSGRTYRYLLCLECGDEVLDASVGQHIFQAHVAKADLVECGHCDFGLPYAMNEVRKHQAFAHRGLPEAIRDNRDLPDVQQAYREWRWRCFPEIRGNSGCKAGPNPRRPPPRVPDPPASLPSQAFQAKTSALIRTPKGLVGLGPPQKASPSSQPPPLGEEVARSESEAWKLCLLCSLRIQSKWEHRHVWRHLHDRGNSRLVCQRTGCVFQAFVGECMDRHEKDVHGGPLGLHLDRTPSLQAHFRRQHLECFEKGGPKNASSAQPTTPSASSAPKAGKKTPPPASPSGSSEMPLLHRMHHEQKMARLEAAVGRLSSKEAEEAAAAVAKASPPEKSPALPRGSQSASLTAVSEALTPTSSQARPSRVPGPLSMGGLSLPTGSGPPVEEAVRHYLRLPTVPAEGGPGAATGEGRAGSPELESSLVRGSSSSLPVPSDVCGLCGGLVEAGAVEAHVYDVHLAGKRPFRCGHCPEEFLNRHSAYAHAAQSHSQPLVKQIIGVLGAFRQTLTKAFPQHF